MRRLSVLLVAVAATAVSDVVVSSLLEPVAAVFDGNEPAKPKREAVVRVVLLGATGNLATKYLWTALFRLALHCHTVQSQTLEVIAAATHARESGERWTTQFLDTAFLRRYAPLRTEEQYLELKEALEQEDGTRRGAAARSSELAHKYLRPDAVAAQAVGPRARQAQPFFRVVVEKPFGSDLESARELQLRLREYLDDDEVYLIDHYAGKPAVQALGEYFARNHAQLHPKWNSDRIRAVAVRMSETETTGIIRDVMVNHLQLLLGLAVSPSLQPLPDTDDTDAEDYAAHYEQETGVELSQGAPFVPTAALVELESSTEAWKGTRFVLSATKAAHERRLEVRVLFQSSAERDLDAESVEDCELRVTIQTQANAPPEQSQRIEWSCSFLDGLVAPSGWQYDRLHRRALHPTPAVGGHRLPWQLGDKESAYDVLLREVSRGNRQLFASIEEAIASWSLWTPVVQQAERATPLSSSEPVTRASNLSSSYVVYPSGSASWISAEPPEPALVDRSDRDEL
ncbi:hypothetical protein PybrP1_001281 [[Pythium] brassicae (nom. inval.)]|nr:hypothetical protein PybrP1_001281 [[Pythium] brassicae (nom. inval.)]